MDESTVTGLPSFEHLVRDELDRVAAARDRERMGTFIAFIPRARAQEFADRGRFYDFSTIPSLAESFQRERSPEVVVDADPDDEDRTERIARADHFRFMRNVHRRDRFRCKCFGCVGGPRPEMIVLRDPGDEA